MSQKDLLSLMEKLGRGAVDAAHDLSHASNEQKNQALQYAIATIEARSGDILQANKGDMMSAKERGISGGLLDRLWLDDSRLQGMVDGIAAVMALPDPVGATMAQWDRPNGLRIARVRVPLGVIGIIFESRPNVAADAGSLCLKSGNAVILRPGSESFNTSRVITQCIQSGCEKAGLPLAAVQMVPTADRMAVDILLKMDDVVDVIVPRGGTSLIRHIKQNSRIATLSHLSGLCHTYIHHSASPDLASVVACNAKMRRPGICGATETILIDRQCLENHVPSLVEALGQRKCEMRGDADICRISDQVIPATDEDWDTEYLDAIVAIKTVDDIDAAIDHIRRHGSGHTEAILAEDKDAVEKFFAQVNSAIIMHNTSTQFADGYEFGMGGEIGIATGKLHARGPVSAEQLTSYKYIVRGQGQTRP